MVMVMESPYLDYVQAPPPPHTHLACKHTRMPSSARCTSVTLARLGGRGGVSPSLLPEQPRV